MRTSFLAVVARCEMASAFAIYRSSFNILPKFLIYFSSLCLSFKQIFIYLLVYSWQSHNISASFPLWFREGRRFDGIVLTFSRAGTLWRQTFWGCFEMICLHVHDARSFREIHDRIHKDVKCWQIWSSRLIMRDRDESSSRRIGK
jgi:hypothetical protein